MFNDHLIGYAAAMPMAGKVSRSEAGGRARHRKPRGMGFERRGEILAAAREMFIAEGYGTVTTRKLAERAGISQTGLYVYFKNKEEILDALCRATFEQLAARFRRVEAKNGSYPDLLRRIGKAYVEFALEHPDEYELTFMASGSLPKFSAPKDLARPFELQGVGVQVFMILREHVANMAKAGLLGKIDVTLASQVLWAGLHGMVALLIARPGYLMSGRRQLADTMIETLIAGLQASRQWKEYSIVQ